MRLLAVNAGSTSVKLSAVDDGDETLRVLELGAPAQSETERLLLRFADECAPLDAVCHRIVHGGRSLHEAVVVNSRLRTELDTAAAMAPLHVPPALHLLDLLSSHVSAPAVACFDTAFHARMPDAASIYAVPEQWRRDLGVRRYGFHGLSCAWSLRSAASMLSRDPESLQLLVAHLGGGCSVTAVRDGHGVDTTMGFSPLEGMVMATRSGSVDPAGVLWLQTAHGMGAAEVGDALEHRSGLLALAGTADMREVLARAHAGEENAALALATFLHSLRTALGSMAMSLERIDAVVFTGGIGERATEVRERALAGSPLAGSVNTVLIVHAREDLEMAHQARWLLSAGAG